MDNLILGQTVESSGLDIGDRLETLVVGEGPYARSLAHVVGGTLIEMAKSKLRLPKKYTYRVQRVLVVVESRWLPVEAVERSDRIYKYLKENSQKGPCHRLSLIFICPDEWLPGCSNALADGFGLDKIEPEKGINVWVKDGILLSLLQHIANTSTADWSELVERRNSRPRRRALSALVAAILSGPEEEICRVAQGVWSAFEGALHNFENYCRPPDHHPNANAWRAWLEIAVTKNVTHQSWAAAKKLLPTLNANCYETNKSTPR